MTVMKYDYDQEGDVLYIQSNHKQMSWRGALPAYLFNVHCRQVHAVACPEAGVSYPQVARLALSMSK